MKTRLLETGWIVDLATTLKVIESWPVSERLELVERVWDRIVESGWRPELTDDQLAELERRAKELEANPERAVSWDSIVQHVRRER